MAESIADELAEAIENEIPYLKKEYIPLDDLHNIRNVNTVVFEGEIVNEKWMSNLQ